LNTTVLHLAKTFSESNGYEDGPIIEALKNNQPVIINEFVELEDWTFLNGLLTTVPATDEEAGPMPTFNN